MNRRGMKATGPGGPLKVVVLLFAGASVFLSMSMALVSLRKRGYRLLGRHKETMVCRREYLRLREIGLGTFAIIHELRNLVAAINGHSKLYAMAGDESGKRQILHRLNELAVRVETFTGCVLEFSKSLTLCDQKPLRLSSLLRNAVDLHFPGRRRMFHFGKIPPAEPLIQGDAHQLERAFANLFRNSLEAGARRVEIHVSVSRGRVLVQIEDDGKGCSREELERLMQPFYSTKRGVGLRGLGLCLAKAIFEMHGGSLRLLVKNGMPGAGAGMLQIVRIPLADDKGGCRPNGRMNSSLKTGMDLVPKSSHEIPEASEVRQGRKSSMLRWNFMTAK